MKKVLCFFLCLFCSAMMTVAQQAPSLPNKVKVKCPEILDGNRLPRLKEDLYPRFTAGMGSKWGQDKTVNKIWVVYSDRDNNKTYMTPEASEEFTTLSFGEEVCIAEIKNDMALVYVDSHKDFIIPPSAKCKGWVPMEKLLLWKKCPTDTRGVQMKGLIAINLNNTSERNEFKNVKSRNPEEVNRSSTALNLDMNYYYVMKETPDQEWSLLCTGAEFSLNTLYGWVHKTAYTVWNQRTCLEPNWLSEFVLNHSHDRTQIYDDKGRSKPICEWKFGIKNNVDDEMSPYRMSPNMLRFPVLGQVDENGMIQCTAFADKTRSANSVSNFDNVTENVNKEREAIRQMNIILAVEASSSMAKFLPAVEDAINTCNEYSKQGLIVQVGLVLYRDSKSGIVPSDIVPLCNYDDAKLHNKMSSDYANTDLSGDDPNVSLAKAIETAANSLIMGFKENQSNLVLLIGYHGADEKTWKEDSLLNVLKANNVQLSSIQIKRQAKGSCTRYFDLISSLVKENANTQYKNIGADAKFSSSPDHDGYKYVSTKKGSGTNYNTQYASIRYNKTMDEEMQTSELTQFINSTINGFAHSINASIEVFEKSLADIDFYPDFLINRLGKRGYDDWKNVKAIFAYSGYAKIGDLGTEDEWQSIIYLSHDELKDLIHNLEGVSEALTNRNSDRNIFVDAIRELLKHQLGGSMSDEEIKNMKPEELENAIYGIVNIPSENMRFTSHTLKDLLNRKAVPDEEYWAILDSFDKKYKKLKEILRDGYKYCLEVINDSGSTTHYYWIPLEDLP